MVLGFWLLKLVMGVLERRVCHWVAAPGSSHVMLTLFAVISAASTLTGLRQSGMRLTVTSSMYMKVLLEVLVFRRTMYLPAPV